MSDSAPRRPTFPDKPSQPIRLFVLDDHELVRVGIIDFLSAHDDIDVVGQTGTVSEARRHIVELRPDLALLDVRLPDGSGIELCRFLQSAAPDVACALLTSFDDGIAAAAAVLAGARGFFLKNINTADLATAVREVASGRSLLDPGLVDRALDAVRGLGRSDTDEPLSTRAAAVRDLLVLGCTDQQIAERTGLTLPSVRVHVAEIVALVLAPRWTS